MRFRPWHLIWVIAPIITGACAADGGRLFVSNRCIECHTFKGQGGRMGPDLTAVTSKESDSHIKEYIRNPGKKNPRTRMPSFSHLSGSELRALVKFLNS